VRAAKQDSGIAVLSNLAFGFGNTLRPRRIERLNPDLGAVRTQLGFSGIRPYLAHRSTPEPPTRWGHRFSEFPSDHCASIAGWNRMDLEFTNPIALVAYCGAKSGDHRNAHAWPVCKWKLAGLPDIIECRPRDPPGPRRLRQPSTQKGAETRRWRYPARRVGHHPRQCDSARGAASGKRSPILLLPRIIKPICAGLRLDMHPVQKIAYVASSDFDLTRSPDTRDFDNVVNICTNRATDALKEAVGTHTELQRQQIGDIFYSMGSTHRTIRRLLDFNGPIDPETVDALPLARLQLECLYAVCLMLEDAKYVDHYLQDYWKKRYVQYLLNRRETQNIARAQSFWQTGQLAKELKDLRDLVGITPEQQASVDHEELGTPMPPGAAKTSIARFPTPASVILKINSSVERRRMLERLYAKYGDLCSFAHGLRQASELKRLFDNRSRERRMTTDANIKSRYEQEVVSESYLTSYLSIAQCTAELTTLYPGNLELYDAALKAWKDLAVGSLLTKAIWEIRTKALLKVIG